jgi:hypothetical protein
VTILTRVQSEPLTVDWNSLPLLLDEKKAAHLLGVSLSYLRKSRCEGVIHDRTPAPPFVPVGGRRYYRTSDLKSWVNGLVGRETI